MSVNYGISSTQWYHSSYTAPELAFPTRYYDITSRLAFKSLALMDTLDFFFFPCYRISLCRMLYNLSYRYLYCFQFFCHYKPHSDIQASWGETPGFRHATLYFDFPKPSLRMSGLGRWEWEGVRGCRGWVSAAEILAISPVQVVPQATH